VDVVCVSVFVRAGPLVRLRYIAPLSCHQSSTSEIYTLSLHDALPISPARMTAAGCSRQGEASQRNSITNATRRWPPSGPTTSRRSEEHTSELQSRFDLVCRLLLEKKNGSQLHDRIYARMRHVLAG